MSYLGGLKGMIECDPLPRITSHCLLQILAKDDAQSGLVSSRMSSCISPEFIPDILLGGR